MRLRKMFLIIIAFPTLSFAQQLPEFKVRKADFTNANTGQTEKMDRALTIFRKVMNNKDFQEDLYKVKLYFYGTRDPNRTLTIHQIVKKLYDAKEAFTTDVDHEADIYWNIKPGRNQRKCTTLGSNSATSKWINTWECYVKRTSVRYLTRHIAHEWTHKFYFKDTGYTDKQKQKMFSYRFGALVLKYAKKYT